MWRCKESILQSMEIHSPAWIAPTLGGGTLSAIRICSLDPTEWQSGDGATRYKSQRIYLARSSYDFNKNYWSMVSQQLCRSSVNRFSQIISATFQQMPLYLLPNAVGPCLCIRQVYCAFHCQYCFMLYRVTSVRQTRAQHCSSWQALCVVTHNAVLCALWPVY